MGEDGRGSTDSNSDDKLGLGKALTNDEIDAVSCRKGDHAGTVKVKRSITPVENKNTQRVSGIASQTNPMTVECYYRLLQEFD